MGMTDDQQEYIQRAYQVLLQELNLQGQHFQGTPGRAARAWKAFTTQEPLTLTSFELTEKGGMIILKNHECWSYCPHHLLPVHYDISIGYVPDTKVLGLSKLARIADHCMPLMPIQEDLGSMISNLIEESIQPKGTGVVIHGEHLCMRMRGVESRKATCTTTFMSGLFLEDSKARSEFLTLIKET